MPLPTKYMEPGTTVLLKGRESPTPIYTVVRTPPKVVKQEEEPEPEQRVIGVTEEGAPIVQEVPNEPAMVAQPSPTLTETVYPYSPELAGFIGSYEAWLRPEVATVPGATIELATVRGYPTSVLYPEFWQPKKEKKAKDIPEEIGIPITVAPKDPFKELKQLGPRYVIGELVGEASQIYLMSKIIGKLSKQKVVKTIEYPEVSREYPRPFYGIESYGIPQVGGAGSQTIPQVGGGYRPEFTKELTFKWTPPKIGPSGTKTPLTQTFQSGRQFLVQQTVQATETTTKLGTLTAKFQWVKKLVPETTKTSAQVAIPKVEITATKATALTKTALKATYPKIAEVAISPFLRSLPKAWQREPYPGTKVKIKEELEIVSYEGVKAPTRLASGMDLKVKGQLTTRLSREFEQLPIVRTGEIVEPIVGQFPVQIPTQIPEQIPKETQRQLQTPTRFPQYTLIGRGRPTIPELPYLRVTQRAPKSLRTRFGGGWFLREYPIRPPSLDILGRKRRKRKK